MEKINKLITLLIAIANFAKDIHYNCKGEAFYSKHLLADRIQDNIYDFIDQIKEVFFLASNNEPLPSGEYLARSASLVPPVSAKDKDCFISMENLLVLALQQIEEITEATTGEENLLGAIAQDLQTSLGLVNNQIKE